MMCYMGLFNHIFVPNEKNAFVPRVLLFRHLGFLSAFILFLKLFVMVALFVVYPSEAYFSTVTSANVIELTNIERLQHGIDELEVSERLNRVARQKLEDMFERQYFSHTDPDGEKVWRVLANEGYQYSFAGENLAMNFYSAEEVVSAWMDSEKHRKNLLSEQYQDFGVAVAVGSLNGEQVSLIVQIFGTEYVSTASDFRRSVTSILGVETPETKVMGETGAVTIESRQGSWMRFFVENHKTGILLIGLVLSLIMLLFAFFESKHHHRRLSLGLLTLSVIFAAITINIHFLEAISGTLTVG